VNGIMVYRYNGLTVWQLPINMGNFRNLRVWQEAKDLAVYVYKVTNQGSFSKDLRFRDQIRAASISIASNIAEGDELNTNKQAVNFFYTAKGSTAEVLTQIIIAYEVGHIEKEIKDYIIDKCEYISYNAVEADKSKKLRI